MFQPFSKNIKLDKLGEVKVGLSTEGQREETYKFVRLGQS